VAAPTDIVHQRGRNTLTVTWDDGTVSDYPVAYLRGWCPCAGCQGHGTTVRFQKTVTVTATAMVEVGAYALAIRFSDGHDTGIYTWDWLRRIAPDGGGLKDGVFDGTRFVSDTDADA
jgi:DUF971 family protein